MVVNYPLKEDFHKDYNAMLDWMMRVKRCLPDVRVCIDTTKRQVIVGDQLTERQMVLLELMLTEIT